MNSNTHTQQLEEIDRDQRAKQQQADGNDASPFAQSIVEALDTEPGKQATPLLAQEEIEIEDPPRLNLTAIVCTAIVAICATVVLCVAHPWRSDDADLLLAQQEGVLVEPQSEETPAAKPAESVAKPQEQPKPAPAATRPAPQPAAEQPAKPKKEPASTLPVVKSTPTGTDNPYNNLRLVDASTRLLTKAEVAQMSKAELALARNAIYARHGYQFNNVELKEYFEKQSWFKASDVKIDAIPFTQVELDNIRLIKAQEQ